MVKLWLSKMVKLFNNKDHDRNEIGVAAANTISRTSGRVRNELRYASTDVLQSTTATCGNLKVSDFTKPVQLET